MLTIGLPFYNNEKTLANAIKSVLLQTYQDWELILVNDGSSDSSEEIARSFEKKDNRIKLLSDSQNRGLIFRLNQIIDMANGEYIARMDSDDMMVEDKLEKQMKILIKNPSIDVIDTGAYIINEKDEPIGIRGIGNLNASDKKKVLLKALLFHPTVVAKTSWYKENKYSEAFFRGEDWELWCRTSSFTHFHRIKEPLFLYREGNVNINNYLASMKINRKILKKYSPGVISLFRLKIELMKTYLKSWIYYFSSLFNIQFLLTATRNASLNKKQKKEVQQIIHKITSS